MQLPDSSQVEESTARRKWQQGDRIFRFTPCGDSLSSDPENLPRGIAGLVGAHGNSGD